jgi:hypothetical protein
MIAVWILELSLAKSQLIDVIFAALKIRTCNKLRDSKLNTPQIIIGEVSLRHLSGYSKYHDPLYRRF